MGRITLRDPITREDFDVSISTDLDQVCIVSEGSGAICMSLALARSVAALIVGIKEEGKPNVTGGS